MTLCEVWKQGKFVFLALFFSTLSCSSPVCRQWQFERNCASCPEYSSNRLFLVPENKSCNLEVEVLRSCSGTRVFLNAYSLEFPFIPDNSDKTEVTFCIDDEVHKVYAER